MKITRNLAAVLSTILILLSSMSMDVLAQANPGDGATTFLRKVESFKTSDADTVTFQYIDVPDQASLAELARKMTDTTNFPLVVLKKDVFGPGVKIVKTLDLQILNYELRDRQWQVLDSIHVQKATRLEDIIALEEQRVEVYSSANKQLLEQIDQLNLQLDASVGLTEKAIKARQVRNIWIGTLGGVFGFSVGVLVAKLK